jgi:2-polyprenyl-6-methoxyphenol hydroxylase-like FAD-dependent oxidoreductase
MIMSRTVLITGGAGGIGLAAARRFADEGSRVVLVDLDARALERARSTLVGDGGGVDIVECDAPLHRPNILPRSCGPFTHMLTTRARSEKETETRISISPYPCHGDFPLYELEVRVACD